MPRQQEKITSRPTLHKLEPRDRLKLGLVLVSSDLGDEAILQKLRPFVTELTMHTPKSAKLKENPGKVELLGLLHIKEVNHLISNQNGGFLPNLARTLWPTLWETYEYESCGK